MKEVNLYGELHLLFNGLPRLRYPYERGDKNGIYVMFEAGEQYKGMDRIVRVGSHTGKDRLFTRLNDHFVLRRKSVFRKHIGRCLLVQMKREDYLPQWSCDLISRMEREQNLPHIDQALEDELEDRITSHLRENFSFVLIPGLVDEEKRKRLERALIASLAQSGERCSSEAWLGRLHPNPKICSSKLWNINHLSDAPLSQQELIELHEYSNEHGQVKEKME